MEASQTRPEIDLKNKVVLITGAAQGIGLAATQALLKHGARVSMMDIDEERGIAACTELQKDYSSKNVLFTRCDVTKPDQLKSAFARTKEEFGGIDIVCNNAGIRNEKEWRKMVDINLCAVIEGTHLGLKYMSTKSGGKGGLVINVASLGGINPIPISPVYCATKHGVVGFTRSLKDCSASDGVRINAICPDYVDTKMVRDDLDKYGEDFKAFVLSRLISVDKVADGILDIIADTSKSGAALIVDKAKGLTYVQT